MRASAAPSNGASSRLCGSVAYTRQSVAGQEPIRPAKRRNARNVVSPSTPALTTVIVCPPVPDCTVAAPQPGIGPSTVIA